VQEIIPTVIDDIVGYVHIGALAVGVVILRANPQKCLVYLVLSSVGSAFPNHALFLRTVPIELALDQTIKRINQHKWSHLVQVYMLCRGAVVISMWVMLVVISASWILVLVVNMCFNFGKSQTWIFVKPWEHVHDFQFFDIEKYFGSNVSSLLTILQILTMDHYMSHIVRPIINVYPQLAILFGSLLVIGSFGILNVGAGLIVRESMELRKKIYHRDKNCMDESILVQLKIQALVNRIKRLESKIQQQSHIEDQIELLKKMKYWRMYCVMNRNTFGRPMRFVFALAGLQISAATVVTCPLVASRFDNLLVVPVTLQSNSQRKEFIVDTGSAGPLLFDSSDSDRPNEAITEFQGAQIGTVKQHQVLTLACEPEISITHSVAGAPNPRDLSGVADGILGLGGPGFGVDNSFLFSQSTPTWNVASVSISQGLASGTLKLSLQNIRPNKSRLLPLVSKYFWAVEVSSIGIGSHALILTNPTTAVFDTGSNFFGLSPQLYKEFISMLKLTNCQERILLNLVGEIQVVFEPSTFTLDNECMNLAISQIDQTKLGDISNHEVMVVGTRGLAGKAISLIRTSNEGSSYLQIN
jgi:hypothetical protein